MTKEAEMAYLSALGEDGRLHSLYKPFSNPDCGLTLASIGTVMMLMPPLPARVLDLGCGGGWTSIFFALHGYEVVGQDIAADMIALAEEAKTLRAPGHRLSFVQCDYEDSSFEEAFDCVTFFDSLHHADDEGAAIHAAYKALRPGGRLITHEPGEGHAIAPHSVDAMARFGVNEKDMPPHHIKRLGLECGFSDCRVYPMQHEIQEVFYGARPKPLWSKSGLRRARRVIKMAFQPSERASAIVVMTK
jgi:SAM-dependent methyltransferase